MSVVMAPPKKRSLPKPLPDGFILTDLEKKKWRLGRIIGQGGFGLIYLASPHVDRAVPADAEFVIKLEYHENGPLFSELKFYQRAAKKETIQKWRRDKCLDFLGISTYWGSGQAEHNGLRYRFMAMDRLGTDLQKVCDQNGGRFKHNTVLQLGHRLVDVLEYIHENEYVHADIKAANLMQGHRDPHQVYLADYGLSYRYCPQGVHKEYKENPKKGHDGTIEYTSLDAHKGVAPSRRSDLQILGFCLLHWLCGSLPWDHLLNNPTRVQEAKDRLMQNLPGSANELSKQVGIDEVASFLLYVKSLDYKDKPDYQLLRGILGFPGGDLDLTAPQRPAAGSSSRTEEPRPMKKKSGRGRGQTEAKPIEVDEDSDDEEAVQERKPKQIPAKYLRGPPINKPEQTKGSSSARPAERKLTPGRFDTNDEEKEKTRPKPIDARYLRGPPISPNASERQAKTTVWTKSLLTQRKQRQNTAVNGNFNINWNTNEKHEEDLYHFNNKVFVCEECDVFTNRTRIQPQLWWIYPVLFVLLVLITLWF